MKVAAGAPGESIVLSRGRLRCPNCEQVGSYPGDFKALNLNEKYKKDLNPVYKHMGCKHVFSPGDPWIISAYLSGELVPKQMLDALQQTVRELQAVVGSLPVPGEGRTAA